MKFRNTQVYVLTLFLCSCGVGKDTDESIIIYDPIKNKQFLKLLDEQKVKYRVHEEGLIIYPAEKKEIAKAAFEKVTGKKIPEYQPTP